MFDQRSSTYTPPAGPRRGTRVRTPLSRSQDWINITHLNINRLYRPDTPPPKKRKNSNKPATKRQSEVQVDNIANAEEKSPQPRSSTSPNSSTSPSSEANTTLCSDVPPERQSRADEYIRTLTAIESEAEEIAQIQFSANTDNRTHEILTQQLASIKGVARDEKIRAYGNCKVAITEALRTRNTLFEDIDTRAKAEREQVERLTAECIARLSTVESRISEINARSENHRKRKHALEAEGGFQLGLDVGLMKRAKKD
jgi:hypothetical protein